MHRAIRPVVVVAILAAGTIVGQAADGGRGGADAASVTFSKDVAPILYKSCVSCHRAGEVAPMALLTYEDVRPWAKSIRRKVMNREMPPWGADRRYGKFVDDRSLTDGEVDTIAKWVDGGAARGNDSELPAAPVFAAGWSHGDPDVVIEMPVDFDIPAEGEVAVTDFFTRSPFTHDVYVKALEIRPSTPGVVHHAGVYVIDRLPEGSTLANGRIVDASSGQAHKGHRGGSS